MLAIGDNVNGSDITLEAVQKAMARDEFYNKPIIAHLYKDEETGKWRVGGHDSKWVITNTSIEVINECIPFGTIPESSHLKLEEVLEPDGETINTYLTCQMILWTGRFNIMDAAYNDEVYFNQSCEISINEYHWKENDVLAIDDFTFSALCLLNKSDDASKNVRPCFPSCRVEKMKAFSIDTDKFKQNFELMLDKLKQFETDSATALPAQNNTINNIQKMKGEYNMNFAKIKEVLSTVKCENNKEVCKYRLLDVTDSQVFALDMGNYKPYGFNYAVTKENDSENIVIDFESMVEKSLSATEKIADENFEEFSIKSEIDTIKEEYASKLVKEKVKEATENVSATFQADYNELKEAYDNLVNSFNVAQKKIDDFEKEAKEAEKAEHRQEIDNLVNSYGEKLGKYSAYLVYKANIEDHYEKSVSEVEQDLILMAGKYLTSRENILNKKFNYSPIESGVVHNENDSIKSRYGNLLDKYIK